MVAWVGRKWGQAKTGRQEEEGKSGRTGKVAWQAGSSSVGLKKQGRQAESLEVVVRAGWGNVCRYSKGAGRRQVAKGRQVGEAGKAGTEAEPKGRHNKREPK